MGGGDLFDSRMTTTRIYHQALMFSATMRLEDSLVSEARREQFVDKILAVRCPAFSKLGYSVHYTKRVKCRKCWRWKDSAIYIDCICSSSIACRLVLAPSSL